jgi:trehalose-phosphatase
MTQRLFDALDDISGRLAQASRVFFAADYYGTLCPLADRPDEGSLPSATRRALAELAGRDRVAVAIIGARTASDLETRVGLPGLAYAGNLGLEIVGPGISFIESTAASQGEAIHQLGVALATRLQNVRGAVVEDRGLTITVRLGQVETAEVEDVRRIVHGVLAATEHPFRLTSGERSLVIRPRVDWSKGTAVVWIREQVSAPDALTFYLGDGATDEEAFSTLEEAITVKVGPPEGTAAKYSVDSPTVVLAFLEWLVEQTRGHRPKREGSFLR